jgi:Transposase
VSDSQIVSNFAPSASAGYEYSSHPPQNGFPESFEPVGELPAQNNTQTRTRSALWWFTSHYKDLSGTGDGAQFSSNWSNNYLSKTGSAPQTPIAAFVGIDWADQKHAMVLRAATSDARRQHRCIASDPAALAEWVLEVQERFASQGRILVCLEQSRGALIHFFMGYECLELYPINPKQLASYREALRPSGAKDDPFDAGLLCQFLQLHHPQLRPWYPDDEQTRKLALLCEKRRQAVDSRTALSHQLKSELKQYFPLALALFDNDLTTPVVADFLLRWPNFKLLKKASPQQLRQFFYGHHSRSEKKLQTRLELIQAAQPLTRDSAIVETGTLTTQMLAQQLRA